MHVYVCVYVCIWFLCSFPFFSLLVCLLCLTLVFHLSISFFFREREKYGIKSVKKLGRSGVRGKTMIKIYYILDKHVINN